MTSFQLGTGKDAGLNVDSQVHIALDAISRRGGVAEMKDIYVDMEMACNQRGYTLCPQGKNSLRNFVNKRAVKKGYIHPHSRTSKGWRITPQGQELLNTISAAVLSIGDKTINDGRLPEELPDGAEYREGAVKQVRVNRYERDKRAREGCLSHYGHTCQVCKVRLIDIYGSVAEQLIHVHHLTPLSETSESYIVNPISDLIPVCPNCHAVLHRRSPPYLPSEIAAMLQESENNDAASGIKQVASRTD